MGVSTWDPETGWDTPNTSGDFDKSRGWDRNRPEMGYEQPRDRGEIRPGDYPMTDLQIVPVTPDTDKEKNRGWQPGWKIEDVIRNGTRTPQKKAPELN